MNHFFSPWASLWSCILKLYKCVPNATSWFFKERHMHNLLTITTPYSCRHREAIWIFNLYWTLMHVLCMLQITYANPKKPWVNFLRKHQFSAKKEPWTLKKNFQCLKCLFNTERNINGCSNISSFCPFHWERVTEKLFSCLQNCQNKEQDLSSPKRT